MPNDETRNETHDDAAASYGQMRADALARLAEQALGGGSAKSSADHRQVVFHVDADTLLDASAPGRCELEDGPAVSAETVLRMCCDASLVAMVHDEEGKVLGVGRKTRVISTPLRRALGERDGGCRFPGCSACYVENHHVEHWVNGGETDLDNLLQLCGACHRKLHEVKYYGKPPDYDWITTVMTDSPATPAIST